MEIDKYISELVSHQFPSFYQAEGPTFIAFVQAYYEWMEQSGYTINASKSILDYKDIDSTVDEFLDNFKNEFLNNFPSVIAADKKFIIKHIKDFYQAKGSDRGMKLLFRLLFDDDIEIYDPGQDILRASDGVWRTPSYLEVEHNVRSRSFINQQITGSLSNATAFVESVHTKVINRRMIDVINISQVQGKFLYQELITNDGNLYEAPRVIGSLTSINITDGGANNKIGDVFDVYASTSGKYGKVRVTAVEDGTGRVSFKLVDGGSGYTTSASQVHVSNTVLFTTNRTNSSGTTDYTPYDLVSQSLSSIYYTVSTPTNPNTAALYQSQVVGWAAGSVVANGIIVSVSGSNTFIINTTNGNFSTATSIGTPANAVLYTGYTYTNVSAVGTVTGSNGTAVGLHNLMNNFYSNGVIVSSANLVANVSSVSTGSGANFAIGSLSDTEVVYLFTDFIGGNNVNYVPYLNMVISGGNSNTGLLLGTQSITANSGTNIVTGIGGTLFLSQIPVGAGLYAYPGNTYIGTVNNVVSDTSLNLANVAQTNCVTSAFYYNISQYGFPKNYAAGYNSIINDALTSAPFTIGSIASLSAINPGTNYNVDPFVLVRNDYVAGYNRRNIILDLQNPSGIFAVGDSITQTILSPTITISYNAAVGSNSFTVGEGVTQSNGSVNSYATINGSNSSTLVLTSIRGTFYANTDGGGSIFGLASGVVANVTTVASTTTATLARGTILNIANSTNIEMKRTSFNESFQIGSTITSTSGGSATIVAAYQNTTSQAMGNNAIVTDKVTTARGIATELEIISSGYGHQPNDIIELTNANNIFAITGTANVTNQGVGEGYWENTRGMLNSNKYIMDGDYYQDFSYEIQSRLSIDKYADILKQLAHVVGTKMYGRVLVGSAKIKNLTTIPASIGSITNPVLGRNYNNIVDRSSNYIQLRGLS
jgi:hypothetical protein